MDCRLKWAQDISADIKDIIGVGRNSAKALQPNVILLPVGGLQGNNKSLKTKENTLEWAREVKTKVDKKYQADKYGSIIHIDNNKYPNGTIINITITKQLLDGYEAKYGSQTEMFQQSSKYSEKELMDRINNGLMSYVKANDIPVEFLQTLQREYPNDPASVFTMITGAIKINQDKAGADTLAEELAHHLTVALGDDNILVQRALTLLGRVNLTEIFGSEYDKYFEAYNGDMKLMRKEALGKLISKAIVSNYKQPNELRSENGTKLWDTVKRLLERFISLFRPNENIMSEIQKDVDRLAEIIIKGDDVSNGRKIKPDTDMYQFDKTSNKLEGEHRLQYRYYTNSIAKLNKDIKKYLKAAEDADSVETVRLYGNIAYKEAKISRTQKALDELLETGNEQLLISLAEDTLKEMEEAIKTIEEKGYEGYTDHTLDFIRNTLDTFTGVEHTSKTALGLKKRFRSILIDAVRSMVSTAVGREVTQEEIDEQKKDIFAGVKDFGTLVDVSNYLAATIGDQIKRAQHDTALANKKAYEDVNKEVEALHEYSKANNVDPKNMYKPFIQAYNGTTILTRPYTSEFYELIQKSYDENEMSEEAGKKLRKSIATFKDTRDGEKWIPKSEAHYNPNYKKIQSTPELKRFYDFFKKSTQDAFNELPINGRANFIPNVTEQSLLDILSGDQTVGAKLSESISYITNIYEMPINETGETLHEDALENIIPIRYIKDISPDKKSNNLGDSLLRFLYFTNSYKHMSEVLPKANLLLAEIGNREYTKNTNDRIRIDGDQTNAYKMAKAFIEMQIKDRKKNDDKLGAFQYGKAIDFMLRYTSLLRIGLNPFNAMTNVFIGKIGNNMEAWGGRYFNRRQLSAAERVYATQTFNKNSKLNALIKILNPLMELEDYEMLEKLGEAYFGSKKYQDKLTSLMYWPQKEGERYLQTSTMIASLMHDKITDKDGKEVSLWEAFGEDGKWDSERFGELTQDRVYKMSGKVHRINEMIHGRYSAKDAATITRNAFARMFYQFKKWMPSAIESRLGEKKFDTRLGEEVHGRWFVYAKWYKRVLATLKGDVARLESLKYTETDIYNMRKNIAELSVITATILAYAMLGGFGDDDDKLKRSGWYKFIMQQLDRVSGDLLQFYNPAEVNRTFTGGAPMLKTTRDMIKAFQYLPYTMGIEDFWYLKEGTYEKGMRKGENKGVAALVDITPVVKPVVDVWRTWKDDVPYEEPQRR